MSESTELREKRLELAELEQGKAAHEEMDLLTEALVLGGKLLARRTA